MRLTNHIRKQVLNSLLVASPLHDQYVKLRQDMIDIAREITLTLVPQEVQDKVAALTAQLNAPGIKELSRYSDIFYTGSYYVYITGQKRTINPDFRVFSSTHEIGDLAIMQSLCKHEFTIALPELVIPYNSWGFDLPVLKTGLKSQVAERYIALYDSACELSTQIKSLETTLKTQLSRFTTDTKLIEEWPEVADYIPAPVKKPSTELSVPVGTLNKPVGLPKDKK